jgi:DNA repair exonuclease SbcCD ATPase subunit
MIKKNKKYLFGVMLTEVMKLLKKQKEDTDLIEILKTKVASYSGKIVELQHLIQEKGLTNVEALEQELRKMAIKNEELLKKIAQLEKDMHEASRSAEKLMASIESEDGGNGAVSLKDQLDRALEQIRELMEWRKKALNEMTKLRDEQSELTALLGQMDKLVKTAVKSKSNTADSNKRAWEQLQQLVSWSGSKLDDLQSRVDEFTDTVKKPILGVEKMDS